MPGIFDSYQLANSRSIPDYQGSAIPELTKVASTMQDRYDTGVQQSDLLDQALKTSTAAAPDQPVLRDLKDQYRQKLQGYADKGDYENMWRNVALDAQDFAGKYKTIDANRQAISAWSSDLDKRVGEGKLDSSVASARKLQMQDTYTGLKNDPETGQLVNPFVGASTVPSIDVPEKVNKWLQDSHAIERGWKAEKDINGWYITNGQERKSLPWSTLKPIIDSGMQLDPEVKAYLSQEHELAPYYSGITKKITPEQVQTVAQNSPGLASAIQDKIHAGMDPVSALHSVIGDQHVRNRVNEIYDYAKKGVIDESKSEYAERMDPITEERLKKQSQQMLFSAPFSDVGPGQQVKSLSDFNTLLSGAGTERDNAQRTLDALRHAPDVVMQGSSVMRKQPDGSLVDITADASRLQDQVKARQDNYDQLKAMQQAAANSTGYHPEQMSPAQEKKMKANEDDLYNQYAADMLREDKEKDFRTVDISPAEKVRARQMARDGATAQRNTNHPVYNDYEQELIKRLQPQGVGNRMLVFKDDDMKKTLADFATGSISNLGAKSGLISLQIGSGPDIGKNIDASDYDDIKGKVVPLGITNDARTGEPKIVMRATQDIRGKKVKGENMVLSMKDVGGLDDYVKSHVSPQEYTNYKLDQVLKGGLNNTAGQMDMPVTDQKGQTYNIRILRRNTDRQGTGSFAIRVQTPGGWKEIPEDSYEGVIDYINRIQANQK